MTTMRYQGQGIDPPRRLRLYPVLVIVAIGATLFVLIGMAG